MRKVGVITICKCNNYGADLQAFATISKLLQMGFEVEIIDYLYYKSWKFKDSRMSRPFVPMSKKEMCIYWLKYRLVDCLITTIGPYFIPCLKKRIERFLSFYNRNLSFSRQYRSMDELYNCPPQYDIYLTGSDQVWNPAALSSIEPYFLTFSPKGAKRVSYAASFGVSDIDGRLRPNYSNYLGLYDKISVREANGRELVRKLCGKDSTWVLDPTLLLDRKDWMQVARTYPHAPQHYILIYQLSESKTILSLARRLSLEKSLPILRITKRAYCVRKDKGVLNILDAGPSEFISLILNADYVLTNSFHGTVFSINFGVPFWTIVSACKDNNSRMESLLGLFALENRLLYDNCKIEKVDIEATIRYDLVSQKLSEERMKSESFLRESL